MSAPTARSVVAPQAYRAPMRRWTIGVDTGGTFTDCIARCDDGRVVRAKVPSSGELRARVTRASGQTLRIAGLPKVPNGFWAGFELACDGHAPRAVIQSRTVDGAGTGDRTSGEPGAWSARSAGPSLPLEQELDLETPSGPALPPGSVVRLRAHCGAPALAVRVALGQPLSEPLEDIDLRVGTTIGTNALLEGRTARVLLVTTAGHEDALAIGDQRRRDIFALAPSRRPSVACASAGVRERMAADGTVVTAVHVADVDAAARAAVQRGCQSIAVAFLHSGVNPEHEREVAQRLASAAPHVVASADVATSTAFLPRANAAAIEAALRPALGAFVDSLRSDAAGADLFLSASSGSPVPARDFMAKDSLLSGPATGVAAAAHAALACGFERCVTLDVGGTSADASRATAGVPDLARQTVVAEVELASPCVAVESVAAGGGSALWWDGSALRVGPRSAGASPGPACYGAGGPLTLTDAQLLLGRIDSVSMPIPMDVSAARRAATALLEEVRAARDPSISLDSLLLECIAIADESMAGALRASLAREGESASDHALVAFGGAGGLHACAIAGLLGMPAVVLPADAGLLCAQGAMSVPLRREESRIALIRIGEREWDTRVRTIVGDAYTHARDALLRWGVPTSRLGRRTITLSVRRSGQEEGLPIRVPDPMPDTTGLAATLTQGFRSAWIARFGTAPDDRPLEIEQVRVEVVAGDTLTHEASSDAPSARHAGHPRRREGPCVLPSAGSTAWVPEGWCAEDGPGGAVILRRTPASIPPERAVGAPASIPAERAAGAPASLSTERAAGALAAAAAEMGEQLRRTALSVNVRDRLDFSCGILDSAGRLIVNAPHIPVHLGALGACVRAVLASHEVAPGEVWCVNHPRYGGAHLPDVTVLAAVHERDDPHNAGAHLGFVAARAHHAEIGGTRPGSMPPDATCLAQEGVVIPPTLLSRGDAGHFDAIDALLRSGPWPSRSPAENIADLRAQVAALVTGRNALRAIAARAGVASLRDACECIARASAAASRRAIASLAHPPVGGDATHTVTLDDGTPLTVRMARPDPQSLTIDFSGTGGPHPGNLNMPESVTRATILYVMRLLVARAHGSDGLGLPVSESLLDPVSLHIPCGCILHADIGEDPSHSPAVAVGQTDTAQRLVDLLLGALGIAAESQGTMNNLLFGTEEWGFYETICGGAGGSIDGPGHSAIHTHLTNTRITDVEVLERRHPVRVERFAVRRGSGGAGRAPGGDGAVRAIRFLCDAAGSFLSQHRSSAPAGLGGGAAGSPGSQRVEHADGHVTHIGGRAAFDARPGDLLVIETPGGGGFGASA